MTIRAFIVGCAGTALSADEIAYLRRAEPWGVILFKRNVESPEQVRALTGAIREALGRAEAPILVDQEGGRVQRMGPPKWPAYPAGRVYAGLRDPALRRGIVRLGARLMAHDLKSIGINVDCAPVLDVPVPGAHGVIGDRALGADADTVAELGRAVAEGLLAGGVLPVLKHMPGHGRAGADSHEALPVVEASLEELEAQDFEPFRRLADMPLAMTAHVVFTALDPESPATTSTIVIRDIVRGRIGFHGLLLSDDLSMQALSGSLRERAEAVFQAGCDLALHCNGKLEEMERVAETAPPLAQASRHRAEAALARIGRGPEPFDPVDARAEFEAALAVAA